MHFLGIKKPPKTTEYKVYPNLINAKQPLCAANTKTCFDWKFKKKLFSYFKKMIEDNVR